MASTTQYTLDQYKTDAQKELERKRAAQQQSADISHQKLMKYLPQQTKGYSIGMTETAKIAANNAYQRQLAEADAAYTDGVTELNNYVRQEQERLEDKAKAEQAERYNEIMNAVRNGDYNTTADLEKYLGITSDETGKKTFGDGSVGAGLSDFQQANLLNLYNTIANDPAQIEADKEYAQTHNEDGSEKKVIKTNHKGDVSGLTVYTEGNNFTVGGYKVELGKPVGESVVPAASVEKLENGRVFAYNGSLFIKVGNKIYSVRDRDHVYSSEDYAAALKLIEEGEVYEVPPTSTVSDVRSGGATASSSKNTSKTGKPKHR